MPAKVANWITPATTATIAAKPMILFISNSSNRLAGGMDSEQQTVAICSTESTLFCRRSARMKDSSKRYLSMQVANATNIAEICNSSERATGEGLKTQKYRVQAKTEGGMFSKLHVGHSGAGAIRAQKSPRGAGLRYEMQLATWATAAARLRPLPVGY